MARRVTTFSHRPAGAARVWPRAAVFDCDGLLVDTASCWHAAFRSAARQAGAPLDGFDIRSLDGASTHSAAITLSRALGALISPDAIADALEGALIAAILQPMPGAESLLTTLRAAQVPIAVASNAPQSALRIALARAGLAHLVPTQLSAETAGRYKPDPDVYRRACGCLSVDPSDAIALEDSATGARAARAAGLTVIGVPRGPGVRDYADLVVPRLDDPRVFELFGVRVTRPA